MAQAHDPYALSDEDRLPWLEPVDDVEEERGAPVRWLAPLLALLVVSALAVGGVWWWQNRDVEPSGSGELIAAPEGPYKVKPPEEGGMKIEGQGEMAFATSEGAQVQGSLDLNAVPETPVERVPIPKPTPTAAPKASASAVIIEEKGGTLVARAAPAQTVAEAAPGATIQLGAFPSQDSAKKTWDSMSKRFAYLADRSQSIVKADVNGRTFYRLRVGTGSPAEAKDVCARLRVAGENCLVVN
ncbi:SPOR domain-containing protein [Sphingomonas sp.]|uniref:SPOR domain-containing protein n=1 Tax=Sphingomonas sp. TaxID=28214 RepID=UPI002DE3471A|nr:SPOR domain-containing protein [Sphingomonas sp.]HEV2568879.1 SPOR domain-containing protein [Sphingomonas sp.]